MISIDDPEIAPFLSMRARLKHHVANDGEFFVAESEEVVQALLKSDLEIISFLILEKYRPLLEGRTEPIYIGTEELMQQIVGFKMHQGVMALACRPKNVPLKELGESIVVLNSLADAENVGAIVRNCAALGVRHLIIDKVCSTPYLRRSVKVSRGAIFSMHVHECSDLQKTLSKLQQEGYSLIATTPGGSAINQLPPHEKYALIIGSEGSGIAPEILQLADERVGIPMQNGVDSLNAAAATAIFLYQLEMR